MDKGKGHYGWSPFLSPEDNIEILTGACQWRDEVIANLRQQIENLKTGKDQFEHLKENK